MVGRGRATKEVAADALKIVVAVGEAEELASS